MRYWKSALRGAAVAGGLAVAGFAPAHAGLLTWDLSSQLGDLGPTASYMAGAYTITATGFASQADCPGACAMTDLYGKNDGGTKAASA
jgi:hypothetical protein